MTRDAARLATRSEDAPTEVGLRAAVGQDCSPDGALEIAAMGIQLEVERLIVLAQALKISGLSVTPSLAFRVAGRARLMSRIAATSTPSQTTMKEIRRGSRNRSRRCLKTT